MPDAGPVGEPSTVNPRITAVDTTQPPRGVWVQMDQPGYAAVLLVAPGHSATLLYPFDSATNNNLTAGAHRLALRVPDALVALDSLRNPPRPIRDREPQDSAILNPGRVRTQTRPRPVPISPTTPTYLLFVTSPRPLTYQRLIDKTAGVSIPNIETEALNAVGKAVKSTIESEPREWAGYYQRVELRRTR
jgi:hypothetical protein